jgi:hypothetical protein
LLQGSLFDLDRLRDRSIARPNPDLVDLIRLRDSNGSRDIQRSANGWIAPPETVAKIFRALIDTKTLRYAPATPSELAACGLDQSPARLELLSVLSENTPEALAGEHPVLRLSIGPAQPDGSVPVHIEGTPEIAFVPAEFLKILETP